MSFLNITDKYFLITGVANKKSVAYSVGQTLLTEGARLVLTVQNEAIKEKVQTLFPSSNIYICDVESDVSVKEFARTIKKSEITLSGMLHSIAFANYSEGIKPFHETKLDDFLQATNISCFSLVSLTNALLNTFKSNASIVTVSISDTRATSYGYMGPIKAMLNSTVDFLAKSLSEKNQIRVNSVGAGPLKTSASAGIPGYVENYLYAEQLTLRKEALKTQEVANSICFLLSEVSSGVNATQLIVDAGMGCNTFDQKLVNKYSEN